LSLLLALLARFEREPFDSPRLCQLRAELDTAGVPASRQISHLVRLVDWLEAQGNLLFALIAPLVLWNTQFAFAIEAWRARCGLSIARWLAAIGELEALAALSTYAYENPTDPFPEIADQGTCFQAEGLCHPLIAKDRCVANDVRLGTEPQLLIVSGSNMSGKSTLLRTIGANTVLAFAGAPVRAKRLLVSRVIIGATLRIQDSLQAGRSRFFAEITRVQQLLEMAKGTPPLLFLLDEVLQGTNSHDRRIGAEAIVRTLTMRGAIGLLTTHDLALTQIADLLGHRAANVHFEDQFQEGQMTFDYRIHPGVVQHGNALALMRAIGIEV
jgi:DNA mismatch repair ATPase MutS